MSEKMICPGCDSYSSSILSAFREERPCPYCGLSAETTREIEEIRQSRADEALKAKLETVIKERDEAQREARAAKARLTQAQRELDRLTSFLKKPLKEEGDQW